MVDWKKEINLSDLRPKRDEAPPAKPPARKGEPAEAVSGQQENSPSDASSEETVATPAPAPDKADGAPKAEKPSLLKREISFKRKPPNKADRAPKSERTSLLKKEISFKRKPTPKRSLEQDDDPTQEVPKKPRRLRMPSRELSASKRSKRLVGLKIGASQIAAARVVNNGGPELVQVARESLDHGLVVGGELREPELLAEALRAFFRKNALPRQGVRLGIANNRIGVRIFELAGITDSRQLENAIRYRAQEVLPIPIEEAVLDYHVLGERVDDEGNTVRRILLVVAYRELIDRYVAACKKAGIRLVGIDLEAFALLRALAEPRTHDQEPADAAVVVVAIGHDRSTFAVSDGRVCEFTRVLEWGGGTLDVAIARELDCAPSEAEPVKRELSLATDSAPEGLTPEKAEAAREAVRRQLQTFARELVSSLQFYQNQPGSLGIGEIVITGGTAHLGGLAEELQKLIGVRVTVGDPLARVKLGKKVRDTEQLGSLSVAIGLGIED
ncbi:MAG: type IV pilus assembly protein PilM [Gaiellaceae bacterium]